MAWARVVGRTDILTACESSLPSRKRRFAFKCQLSGILILRSVVLVFSWIPVINTPNVQGWRCFEPSYSYNLFIEVRSGSTGAVTVHFSNGRSPRICHTPVYSSPGRGTPIWKYLLKRRSAKKCVSDCVCCSFWYLLGVEKSLNHALFSTSGDLTGFPNVFMKGLTPRAQAMNSTCTGSQP